MSGRASEFTHDVYWYWTPENLSPRVTPAFLARQRRLMPPGRYAVEHQNTWSDGADSATTEEAVRWAMSQGWVVTASQEADFAYHEFWDYGLVGDPTVGALGHAEGELILIDQLVTLQGSRAHPVEIAAVEDVILDWERRFDVRRRRIESWQGVATAQRLTTMGVPVEIQVPTAKSNSEEWSALFQLLAAHRLILPVHERLREELLNLTIEVTGVGIRVIDRGAVHQDHAVAVRGVCASLLMQPAGAPVMLWGGGL